MLELRPAAPQGLRASVTRALRPFEHARTGSGFAFLRDGGRIARATLRRALGDRLVGILARIFSFQKRVETAFLASGAATQLADAALEGESTAELAARISSIARKLADASGATVFGRSAAGLVQLGADGEPCDPGLAEIAFGRGKVAWSAHAASVPLRVKQALVGCLSLRFEGAPRDLRALEPLLSRAGAVIAASEREARKDRFLSLAAHELKTPLTSIKGFSYSLARKLERGQPCDPRHVQVLERQAEKLHSLLEELLEVSRIETGRFVLHQEPCEVIELVDATRRALRRMGIDDVAAEVEPQLPLIADRERIERALTAMVLRARALGGGAALIEARRREQRAELRVSWKGEPLGADDRALAFEPRWEVPQAQRQGLGMALLVAKEAAALHGGELVAEEHALVLRLPLRALQPAREGGVGARVLVVDDDEPIARMMAEFFAEHGFDADWAGGGLSALEKVKERPPDLMVLDLRMPDLDGRALLTAVRALGLGPRVVLLSADREVADAARELACEGFVEKPFAPEGLLAAVQRALPGAATK